MNINYITLIPFLTLCLLIGGGVAALLIKPSDFQKTRLSVFISIMGSMAVVVLGFNVYVSTTGLQVQRTVNNAQFTKESIDKLWLFPNQLFTDKTHARPEFLASFYYNNLTLYDLTKDLHNKPTLQSELEEQYIAIVLIQCWEDYLTFRTLEKTGDDVWLCNFLQWAQSPFLKKYFNNLKYNYASTTRDFAALLFEYADQIPVPTMDPNIYNFYANKLLKNPQLLKIFTETENK